MDFSLSLVTKLVLGKKPGSSYTQISNKMSFLVNSYRFPSGYLNVRLLEMMSSPSFWVIDQPSLSWSFEFYISGSTNVANWFSPHVNSTKEAYSWNTNVHPLQRSAPIWFYWPRLPKSFSSSLSTQPYQRFSSRLIELRQHLTSMWPKANNSLLSTERTFSRNPKTV